MTKSVFAAAAAAIAFAPAAALAGPYVNVESNASWAGDDYTGATTDFHVGYEGAIGDGDAAWYVQGGPAIPLTVLRTKPLPGKIGAGTLSTVLPRTEAITAGDDLDFDGLGVGGKLGVKYSPITTSN